MASVIVLDLIWIGFVANNFYRNQIGSLIKFKADGAFDTYWPAAAVVYLCIPAGILFFVLPKVSAEQALWSIIPWGFFFGVVLYGVYDFTNHALLKEWGWGMSLVDCFWGGFLCAASSYIALWVSRTN